MRVAILDYGIGNLHSLTKAFERCEARVTVTRSVADALREDAVVLPGVGHFSAASSSLGSSKGALADALLSGFPCLGICLGMQLLMTTSEEGDGVGLGVLEGSVRRLKTKRIPHMGWNRVEGEDSWIGSRGLWAYFANSYVVEPSDPREAIAWTEHEDDRFVSAVRKGRTFGVQFHPEKSDVDGLALISRFLEEVAP